MCACMRPYDCKGDVSDRNARVWQVGMHGHGGSAHASMSYNVKRKSCNSQCTSIPGSSSLTISAVLAKRTRLLEVSFGTFQLIAQRNNGRFRCSVSIRSRTCSTRSEMLPVSSRKCRHRLVCWICRSDLEVYSGAVLAQGSSKSESEASLSEMTADIRQLQAVCTGTHLY